MTSASKAPLLEVKQLCHQYIGQKKILDEVSFSIESGDRVALVGDNGAGKSTLLQLIVGLIPIQSGEIMVQSLKATHERDFIKVRTMIGLVFQDPDDQLFCPSVIEDVMFGPLNQGYSLQDAEQKSLAILEQLQLTHLSQRMASDLSGGEKRLVTLATVLVMEPKLLLLDEPTNALDDKAQQRLLSVLRSLEQGMIVISHDKDFLAQLTDRSLLLKAGKLTASL
ncbi:MAG: ABC transporter ATP-binding protein [Oceanospirillaceae bacterium]|nr:ABC transporter ATP-binding protein [Oceanospirillaceae bacterium]